MLISEQKKLAKEYGFKMTRSPSLGVCRLNRGPTLVAEVKCERMRNDTSLGRYALRRLVKTGLEITGAESEGVVPELRALEEEILRRG